MSKTLSLTFAAVMSSLPAFAHHETGVVETGNGIHFVLVGLATATLAGAVFFFGWKRRRS